MKPKKPALIYGRYSPRPDAAESDSLLYQYDHCMKRLEFEGSLYCVGFYFDKAISGKQGVYRPGLEAARDAIRRGQARVLISYSLSRLARSTVDAIEISQFLEAEQADLILLEQAIDTSTAYGRLVYRLFASLAEFEREQIVRRTKEAMRSYQEQGRIMGREPPIGYRRDPDNPKMMIPDEFEMKVVERIKSEYRNKPFDAIVADLNKDGLILPNRRMKRWYNGQVVRVLRRAGLIGKTKKRRKWRPKSHPDNLHA